MSLASIIRAQLARGGPLRVTRALLEALAEPPAVLADDPLYSSWTALCEALALPASTPGPAIVAAVVAIRETAKRDREERDEARAEVLAWQVAISSALDGGDTSGAEFFSSRDEMAAAVASLRADLIAARRNANAWADERDAMRRERDAHASRNRGATQRIIEAIGSVGPESVEDAVLRVLDWLAAARSDKDAYRSERNEARAEVERLRGLLTLVNWRVIDGPPIVLAPLAVGARVMAARSQRWEPGTITRVEGEGAAWRCSIFFDEGSGVSWYGPREVAPLAPEHDPRKKADDTPTHADSCPWHFCGPCNCEARKAGEHE